MFAVTNNIKEERVIFAAANACRLEGNSDLSDCVMRNSIPLTNIIDSAWKLKLSSSKLYYNLIPRMVAIRDLAEGLCEKDCGDRWLQLALETLRQKQNRQISLCSRNLSTFGKG